MLLKYNIIKFIYSFIILLGLSLSAISCNSYNGLLPQGKNIRKSILSTSGLIAFWDFDLKQNSPKKSVGEISVELKNGTNKEVQVINEGPVSGYSISLEGDNYLYIPYEETGKLNVRTNNVTVIAWVKWADQNNCFIAGMWNEYQDGGKRQYGLFVSLPYYNGASQVCGHISQTGKPTEPFPFSIDYSASKQIVPKNEWCCIAFTYDGSCIKSYLNGEFESRDPELINNTKGFPGYPDGLVQSKNPYFFPNGIGNNGSDFTVGAVLLKRGMGNFFKGLIGGVAIYDRALTNDEIKELAVL
ncbi:MAG: hypothetical protein A2W90_16010 [Bacteroidetes bacterium GWF2_42_66]|nr:MAG: hypothetical protein A2W92_08690 [Bacteroidetes bacterium GWA2_42_15]OFX96210.1 MAG: hypothetical protein A2W89_04940 [Bacteroidetes bacterium GWE2_42_39]OFY46249.1 MAG: hypothetical protein A2W90_16010 [Bacteroidetes bacterium GWF2_42_66]HAZ01709.1 hypothetical protein [Marinilabiliales bacterium]HBL78380.1 hypothetical protein [Prolixibacteraceae bacterium]